MKIHDIWIQFYQSHEWSSFSPPRRACSFVELLDLSNSRFIASLSTFSCPFSTFFLSFLFISCPIFCFRRKKDGPSHPDALRCILDSVRLGPPVTRQQGGLWHWQVRTQHKRIQFQEQKKRSNPKNQCTSKLCQLYLSSLFEMIPPLCSRGVEVWSFQFFVLHLDLEIWDLMSFSMITSTPQDLPPNGLASLEFASMAFHGGIRLSAFWIHWASYVHSRCTSH